VPGQNFIRRDEQGCRVVMERAMTALLTWLLLGLRLRLKSRVQLEAEIITLRQQVIILSRKSRSGVGLKNIDRLIFICLYRLFPSIPDAIIVVKPETLIRRHTAASVPIGTGDRDDGAVVFVSTVSSATLIRRMCRENPLWGAPRIHGELLMLGIKVSGSSVGRYVTRSGRPRSQGWKTFLRNHATGIASIDLFVVRTISFKLLFALVIVRHARRRLVAVDVTTNPTAEWIANQMTDAFPWDEAPRHPIRDRDGAFGPAYVRRVRAMGIRAHPTAARSPWQNGDVDRLIRSIRRESLDHLVVFEVVHLRHVLKERASYWNEVRTHLSLNKDALSCRARPKRRLDRGAAMARRFASSICSGLSCD